MLLGLILGPFGSAKGRSHCPCLALVPLLFYPVPDVCSRLRWSNYFHLDEDLATGWGESHRWRRFLSAQQPGLANSSSSLVGGTLRGITFQGVPTPPDEF